MRVNKKDQYSHEGVISTCFLWSDIRFFTICIMNVFKMLVFSYISKLLQCSSHCTIDCGLCFVEKNSCSSENHKSAGVERERERESTSRFYVLIIAAEDVSKSVSLLIWLFCQPSKNTFIVQPLTKCSIQKLSSKTCLLSCTEVLVELCLWDYSHKIYHVSLSFSLIPGWMKSIYQQANVLIRQLLRNIYDIIHKDVWCNISVMNGWEMWI